MNSDPHKRRPALRRAAFRVLLVGFCFAVWLLFIYPRSPLPDAWNPFEPLRVHDEVTPLTGWKLRRALAEPQRCMEALATGAQARRLPDFSESEICHIRPQVTLTKAGQARLKPLNTRCQTALRMALWERHGIQPAAERHLRKGVQEILHFSSYSCRQMRTTRSGAPRMSTHATADAVDISGFVLTDGSRVTLLSDWEGASPRAAFLKEVRDSACTWFRVTLGPEYNRLHADHFHLQHTGWGLCR